MPMYAGKLVLLKSEERYRAFFYTENGCFETEITIKDRGKEKN